MCVLYKPHGGFHNERNDEVTINKFPEIEQLFSSRRKYFQLNHYTIFFLLDAIIAINYETIVRTLISYCEKNLPKSTINTLMATACTRASIFSILLIESDPGKCLLYLFR